MTTPEPPDGATVHDGVEGWTINGRSDDPEILADATGLLDGELPDPRFVSSNYLRWLYRENPLGRAWERHQLVADGATTKLVAHYANIPRRFRGAEGERSAGAWSLNAVVHHEHQRARHFTRLGLEIYQEAGEAGRSFLVGVTNDKSTGAVVKYMGWRLVGPLPVRIVQPIGRGRRRMTHTPVDANWLDSAAFEDFAATVDRHPVDGWVTDYTADVLRWRLACPEASYFVHQADDIALITTRVDFGLVTACVVLKAFPLATGSAGIDATRAIRSASRFHRAAFSVYAGFNGSVSVRGLQPPRRFQPSPLNLIIRHLDAAVDQDAVDLDTFEFLDMDAY